MCLLSFFYIQSDFDGLNLLPVSPNWLFKGLLFYALVLLITNCWENKCDHWQDKKITIERNLIKIPGKSNFAAFVWHWSSLQISFDMLREQAIHGMLHWNFILGTVVLIQVIAVRAKWSFWLKYIGTLPRPGSEFECHMVFGATEFKPVKSYSTSTHHIL